jgi:hypothetical protein
MKTKLFHYINLLILLAIAPKAAAQGTAFTYQGQLINGISPANGSYDLTFTLYLVNNGGTAVGGPVTNTATAVSNGLFTTTVDFGPNAFTGSSNWLEIAVSTNGANNFVTLNPRQQLNPTPYAIFASSASNVLGTIPSAGLAGDYENAVTLDNAANSISGTFNGDGSSVANVNAVALNGLTSANFKVGICDQSFIQHDCAEPDWGLFRQCGGEWAYRMRNPGRRGY